MFVLSLATAALPGCGGHSDGFAALGRAILIGIVIVGASAAIVVLTLAIAWGVAFVRGLRGSAWSAAVSTGLALAWLLVQVALVFLLDGWSFGEISVTTWLGYTALIPALALGVSISLLIRRGSPQPNAWMALGVLPVLAVALGILWLR